MHAPDSTELAGWQATLDDYYRACTVLLYECAQQAGSYGTGSQLTGTSFLNSNFFITGAMQLA
jgi:hypothetical protein